MEQDRQDLSCCCHVNTSCHVIKNPVGFKQKSHKEWLSADTWEAIAERKRAKGKLMGVKSTHLKEKLQRQYQYHKS